VEIKLGTETPLQAAYHAQGEKPIFLTRQRLFGGSTTNTFANDAARNLLVKRGGSNLTELTSDANDGGANSADANHSGGASHGASTPQSLASRTLPAPPPRRD
jgi:hypothetical protein